MAEDYFWIGFAVFRLQDGVSLESEHSSTDSVSSRAEVWLLEMRKRTSFAQLSMRSWESTAVRGKEASKLKGQKPVIMTCNLIMNSILTIFFKKNVHKVWIYY